MSGTVLASTNRPLTDSEIEPDYFDESSKPNKIHHPGPGSIRGDQDDEEEYYQDHPTNIRRPVQQQGLPPINRQQVDTTGKPVELLTKLLNQASPLGKQHHQSSGQPFPYSSRGSGFKPIRESDDPIPPLGFEVEAQLILGHHHQDHDDESDNGLRYHQFSHYQSEPTFDRPGLVTLDPVLVASGPGSSTANKVGQRGRPRDSLPVQLPKYVVPVVTGPPSSHQDLPISGSLSLSISDLHLLTLNSSS